MRTSRRRRRSWQRLGELSREHVTEHLVVTHVLFITRTRGSPFFHAPLDGVRVVVRIRSTRWHTHSPCTCGYVARKTAFYHRQGRYVIRRTSGRSTILSTCNLVWKPRPHSMGYVHAEEEREKRENERDGREREREILFFVRAFIITDSVYSRSNVEINGNGIYVTVCFWFRYSLCQDEWMFFD